VTILFLGDGFNHLDELIEVFKGYDSNTTFLIEDLKNVRRTPSLVTEYYNDVYEYIEGVEAVIIAMIWSHYQKLNLKKNY